MSGVILNEILSGRLGAGKIAFFLDCDGTLSEIVAKPDMARVSEDMIACLSTLRDATDGALAVVSGRSITQLDALLSPLVLPVAGVHGVERRTIDGEIFRPVAPTVLLDQIAAELSVFAEAFPGLVCERKTASIALHYRMRPELEEDVLARMARAAAASPQLRLLRGKMVVELSTSDRDKGDAVRDFMREDPFEGRVPVFVGDDVTDEDGFAAVNDLSGISVKIGPGETRAGERFDDMWAFHTWLKSVAHAWTSGKDWP